MDGLETTLQYGQRDLDQIDRIPRPVVAMGVNKVIDHLDISEHQHRKCELIYAVKGVLNCLVENCLWTVSPHSAVWIPSGVPHRCRAFGDTEYHILFFDPDTYQDLPQMCSTMTVSPLLREALIRAAQFGTLYPMDGPEARLFPVILDEIQVAQIEDHHLPIPRDPSLRRLVDMMMSAPADKLSVAEWAARCAMSERTLSRKVRAELGMSLWRWRHQLHVTLALQRMATGDSVQAVALDLGYETASSFITMFKKTTGKSPGRYFSGRHIASDIRRPKTDGFPE